MKTIRTTFWICCFLCLPQALLRAAPPQGYVIEWGWNTAAGTAAPPKQVSSNTVAISAGAGHSLALRSDSTVFSWGGNFLGLALGYETQGSGVTSGIVRINGQILSNVVSVVAAREWSLALKKDGTVVTWGWVEDKIPHLPAGLTNIVAIAAEWSYSWALKHDGTVVGWASRPSSHDYGRLLPVPNLTNVIAIAVGPGGYSTRGVALRRDGTVGHWGGESDYKDATPPAGLSNVVAVAAGANHTLALKSDGTVIGWGFNTQGQATGIRTTNSPSVSSGQVRIGGQVLSNVVSIVAGSEYSLALKKDGTIVTWGRMANGLYPVTVPEGLSNVVAIAAGDNFCLAITTNSTVADRFRQK